MSIECAAPITEMMLTAVSMAAVIIAWTALVLAVLFRRQSRAWERAYHAAMEQRPAPAPVPVGGEGWTAGTVVPFARGRP